MSNYIFKRTDPTNASVVLQPYTVNGPSTPAATTLYSNTLSGLSAVVESTSLVLTGKGVPEYGEFVQNNLIYLMENFAGPTRPRNTLQGQLWYKNTAGANSTYPTDPTTVGLYVWSGSAWTAVVLNTGSSGSGDLDLSGNKIVNLGNPTDPTDALNLGTADVRYLLLSGGTVTGAITVASADVVGAATFGSTVDVTGVATFADDVTFGAGSTVVITTTPTSDLHAANKLYVDDAISAATGGPAQYLSLTGGTVAGPVTIAESADPLVTSFLTIGGGVNFALQAGSGLASMGGRVVADVATPVALTDATTKGYVDAAIAAIDTGGGPGTDTYVESGVLASTGLLTLTRNDGSDVLVTGTFALASHQHTDGDINYIMPLASQSYLTPAIISNYGTYPTATLTNVLRQLDRASYLARAPIQRAVIDVSGSTTSVTLPQECAYVVNENRLEVFHNGVKLIGNERGSSRIRFVGTGIGQQSMTGLTAGTYTTDISVDGATAGTLSFVIDSSGYTYRQIMNRLNFLFQGSPTAGTAATAGRVDYSWTGLLTNAPTGLANNATVYTATITVDGTPHAISITGSTAQDYGNLLTLITTQLGGAALAGIQSITNMRIISATTGTSSSVSITDTNLFANLTGAGTPVATGGAAAVPPSPTTTVYGANARIEQYNNSLMIVIESTTLGSGSAITVSYAPGELFTSIAASSAPVDKAIITNRAYSEVGTIGNNSTVVNFSPDITTGVLEFVVTP